MNARQIIKVMVVGGIIMSASQAQAWVANAPGGAAAASDSGAAAAARSSSASSSRAVNTTTNVNTLRQSQGQGQAVNNGQTVAPAQSTGYTSNVGPTVVTIPPTIIGGQCTVPVSGGVGVGVMGAAGTASFGKTVRDDVCERIHLSQRLEQLGHQKAAVEILAEDARVQRALDKEAGRIVAVPAPVSVPTAAIVEPEKGDNFGQR